MPNDFMNRYNDLLDSLEKQLNELEQIKRNQTEQIELLRTQIDVLTKQNQELTKARDQLLPKLMSGQLDVSGIALPDEVAA